MMKKTLLLFVLCTLFGTTMRAATLQRAVLSHQGKLTQFDQSHWQDAIEQAVAGDTIFLSAGSFPGNVTITKAITLIGAGIGAEEAFYKDTDIATAYSGCATTGESTSIGGDITIAIPGSVTLTKTLLENIRLSGNSIAFTEPVTNPIIKRCQVGMLYDNWWYGGILSASAKVTNLTLENCYFFLFHTENFENADIHNCYLQKIEPSEGSTPPESMQFTNSVIVEVWGTSNCMFENCIIHWFATGCCNTCWKCIYGDSSRGDNNTFLDCWFIGGGQGFTRAQLQEGGYIGTDGTIVGPLGGSAPFTLIPAQPYVSSSVISYNKTTKKVTVSATVNKGK